MAEMNVSSNDRKPKPTHSREFCPHEAGAYYIVSAGTVSKIINLLANEIEPPVRTYDITTVIFEQDTDTGRWIWFDGKEKLSPRKNQDSWRLGSKKLYDIVEDAEAELQRQMLKNSDRVTKVHDLPNDITKLKKIRSATIQIAVTPIPIMISIRRLLRNLTGCVLQLDLEPPFAQPIEVNMNKATILQYIKKHGQKLDREIAKDTDILLPEERVLIAELQSTVERLQPKLNQVLHWLWIKSKAEHQY
jgi:hypothetical protein